MQQPLNLTTASKETVLFSLPLIAFRLVGTINGFLTILLVAMLGQLELAASALIVPIQTTINLSGWSIIFAVSVVVGHTVGEGKMEDLGKIMRQAWLLGIMISIPMILIYWHVGPLLRWFGQRETLIVLIEPYFHVLAFGVLPSILVVSFFQFAVGIGKPRITLFLSLVSIITALLPSYLLLFGKFGLPRLGLIGVAYASVFANYMSLLIIITYILLHPHYKKFQIFKFAKEKLEYCKKILFIGVPMTVHLLSEMSAVAFATIMVGWLDQTSLAASQIVMQTNMIMIMGAFGVQQATSVLVGRSLGKGDQLATKTYSQAGLLIALLLSMITAIIYWFFPKIIISFFSVDIHDPANKLLIKITVIQFLINSFSMLFDNLRNIATGALRGLHDTATPMWIGLVVSWGIAIPVGYLLGFTLNFGIAGIASGFTCAWILGSSLLIRRLYAKFM